ncbi:MAG TPA: 2OG-Fe(II) oxygenase [Rhodanobacteraceae bacterium]|jgi:Rps23 Pro-64 3,4-dihydroxylase Tpa1-like proline 4-hydroxylase
MDSLIDLNRLSAALEQDSGRYATARPFRHIVITDFLPAHVLERAVADFPSPQEITDWRRADSMDARGRVAQSLKLGYSCEQNFSPTLWQLVHELNGGPFLRYLEKLTGIYGLIPDPHLTGGGLHQYLPGAVLRVHADFNRLPRLNLDRRLNLLLYLNEDWRPEWGGDLELWDEHMQQCKVRVPPLANRCVIFSTTSTSFHGMPDPLACPEGRTRRSLALYYYSNGRPAEEQRPEHSTLWQARPHETA